MFLAVTETPQTPLAWLPNVSSVTRSSLFLGPSGECQGVRHKKVPTGFSGVEVSTKTDLTSPVTSNGSFLDTIIDIHNIPLARQVLCLYPHLSPQLLVFSEQLNIVKRLPWEKFEV